MATTTVYTQTETATLGVDDSRHASVGQWSSENSQRNARPRSLLSSGQESAEGAFEGQDVVISRIRAVILIATLTGITFVGSMSGGLLTVGLPSIAADLKLPSNLLLW